MAAMGARPRHSWPTARASRLHPAMCLSFIAGERRWKLAGRVKVSKGRITTSMRSSTLVSSEFKKLAWRFKVSKRQFLRTPRSRNPLTSEKLQPKRFET
jgi:hypothetical protein